MTVLARFALSAAVLLFATAPFASAVEKPNILLIYADDQSYKTVGCYPESWPWVKTPNIDALAKSGVRFHGAYLGGWCMPSRATLLTGRHPHGIQSMRMEGPYPASTYDPQQCPFWPALFRTNGYHTAQIGKWHTGTDAGFGRDWDYQIVWNRPKHPENAGAYYEKQILAFNGAENWQDGYPADNYTKWAVDYVKGANRDKDKPWFLWLCYGSIHGPSKPAPRHKGLYKDARVPAPVDILGPWPGKAEYLKNTLAWRKSPDGKITAGPSGEKVGDVGTDKNGIEFEAWARQMNECVPAIDEGVGELLKSLKDSGQLENTLVVYTADQGYAMGEHGMRMKIAPYDASYRSPFIVSMPGKVAAGKVCKQVVNAPDLISTFFTFAGVTPTTDLHGRNLSPLLKNPDANWPHPCFYEHTGHDYGDNVAKVLKEHPQDATYQKVPWYTAVVHDRWKLIRYLQPGVPEELYDLSSDPDELKNLIAEPKHAERLIRLRESLVAELKRTAAPDLMLSPNLSLAKDKPAADAAAQTPPGKRYIYKTSAGTERSMEVYFPPNHDPANSKVPGMILFHGGGWSGGTLVQFRAASAYFASRGLVCATAEYQMLKGERAKLPAGESTKRVCVIDAKSAIRWFKQHANELGVDPKRIITGGGSAGGHISALATLNPGLNDPTEPKDIDTNVVAYLWFNPAFAPGDEKDPEIDVLHHLKAELPPAIVFFGDRDSWRNGWDQAHAKWKSLGNQSIDLHIAPGQAHGFFNKEPWRTATLIAADRFLVRHGLLTGEPTLTMPASGEKLVPAQ